MTIVGNNRKQNIRLSFIIVNMRKYLRDDVYMLRTTSTHRVNGERHNKTDVSHCFVCSGPKKLEITVMFIAV